MAWTHLVAAFASCGAGVSLIYVAILLRQQAPLAANARAAVQAFRIWWVCIGLATIASAVMLMAAVANRVTIGLVARAIGLLLSAVAIWGLITYVWFLRTGDHRARIPAAIAYVALGSAVIGSGLRPGPQEFALGQWKAEIIGPATPGTEVVLTLLAIAFLAPPIVSGLLLLTLRKWPHTKAQDRRILAVGIGVPVWLAGNLVSRLGEADAWHFVTRVALGLVVAVVIALAYRPVRPERPAGAAAETPKRDVAADLAERMRQIV